ncbi:replication initiation factor family protein [Salmonella enterica]|nr:replication initiation factor family protein [Salmonella enterica]
MNIVNVDHLAFSFQLSYMRDLSRWYEFRPVSGYAGTLPAFPLPPASVDPETGLPVSATDYGLQLDRYKKLMCDAAYARLCLFIDRIFCLSVGPLRSRGMQGYLYSCRLFSCDGRYECGYLMFGGNNDTVHMQISGTGCRCLFSSISPSVLHNVLRGLGVTTLSRIDLALDDFTGNFGCAYAELAYYDGAFRCSERGVYPRIDPRRPRNIDGQLLGETIYVGSRRSRIFWRNYDKALEQHLDGVSWYRSEAELKKVTVDVLSDVDAYFAGICDFSASLLSKTVEEIKRLSRDEQVRRDNLLPCLELLARVRRVRRQVGKVTGDVLDVFQGDVNAAFGLLMRDEHIHKYGFGEYKQILQSGNIIALHSLNNISFNEVMTLC